MTKNSFISAVQHRDRPNDVLIRARRKKDLVKMFPKKEKQILRTPQADYAWRVTVSKKELSKILADYIAQQLTYDNFKGAQGADTGEWMQFLHSVWQAGWDMQAQDGRRR